MVQLDDDDDDDDYDDDDKRRRRIRLCEAKFSAHQRVQDKGRHFRRYTSKIVFSRHPTSKIN